MSARRTSKRLKTLHVFESDKSAERFVAEADLATYDLSNGKVMRFEYERKSAQVNLRMPEGLLFGVKQQAKLRGIPYQRYIRQVLERALRQPERS